MQLRTVLAVGSGEDVCALRIDHALVKVHRTARLPRNRFGHEHGVQPMLDGDFLGRVFEQEGLVGHGQGIAVHEVDLELRQAHFMDPGVALYAKRVDRAVKFVPERRQLVKHIEAVCRLPDFSPAIACGRCHQGQIGIRVGCRQVKLDFGRHYRGQAGRGVALEHGLQHRARGEGASFAVQFHAIVDRQCARHAGPGDIDQRGVIGHQSQVRVGIGEDRVIRIFARNALHGNRLRDTQLGAVCEA